MPFPPLQLDNEKVGHEEASYSHAKILHSLQIVAIGLRKYRSSESDFGWVDDIGKS